MIEIRIMAKLYLVPTPVGNLEDITLRAIRVLREVSLVLAEDTRTTSILLKHHGIATPLLSHHKFNEHQQVERLVERLADGQDMALVSDAGTPGISDPGFLLVRACVERGIPTECLPGPTAFVPALVNSGLPCDRFCFEGFLPQKKGRLTRLARLADEERTVILYESPFRLVKTLQQLADVVGPDRLACVAREISKIHEDFQRGTLADLVAHFTATPPRGEIVILLAGKTARSHSSE